MRCMYYRVQGVARILEKRGQKCKVIVHKPRKHFRTRSHAYLLNHVRGLVIQYAMLIHQMLTRGACSLEVSETFVRKEMALSSALL